MRTVIHAHRYRRVLCHARNDSACSTTNVLRFKSLDLSALAGPHIHPTLALSPSSRRDTVGTLICSASVRECRSAGESTIEPFPQLRTIDLVFSGEVD
jgi:hypothetical protein